MAVTVILLLAWSGVVSPDKLFTKLLGKSFPAPSLLGIQILAWEYHLLVTSQLNLQSTGKQQSDRRKLAMGYINHTIQSLFYVWVIISTVFPNPSVKSRILKPVSHWQCISNNIPSILVFISNKIPSIISRTWMTPHLLLFRANKRSM